ncbi:MAG: LacI family DNA-binding transcriptional regulator [Chloroflexota bacterium]
MPTIRDVANLAGVAPITVSRVINASGYVSQETRQRVESAIESLGYVPNMLGPSLRFQQTMTLALVVTDITNPFFTTVTRGVEDIAQGNGYSTIICNTDESEEKQARYLHMLLRRKIDGILMVPASSSAAPIRLIQRQNVPIVVLDRQIPGVEVDIVRADSETGAYELTTHLLSLGHRRIAVLAGPESVSTAVDRVNGYRRAMHEAGLDIHALQIFWGNFTQESGRALTQKALSAPVPPTAIFASNNFIAIGVMQALQEKKVRIPEDMALVTVDDIHPTFTIYPFLTVVTQPAREMGRQAATLLLEKLKRKDSQPCQQIVLSTKTIIRASSGVSIPP